MLFWKAPVKKKTELSVWHIWHTDCGKYRVVRVKSEAKGDDYYAAEHTESQKILGNDYDDLDAALRCCERHHSKHDNTDYCEDECARAYDHAKKKSLHNFDAAYEQECESLAPGDLLGAKMAQVEPEPIVSKPGKSSRPPSRAPGPAKIGIIATIIEVLQGASEETPATHQSIHAVLVARFGPATNHQRDPRAMLSTVKSQVPTGLRKEKPKLKVRTSPKGYWIEE